MSEWRFFPEGTIPEEVTAEWYAERETAPHIDQDMHRPRLLKAAEYINDLYETGNIESLVDVGCGDGGLLSVLNPSLQRWGYDLCPANVTAAAHRGVNVQYGNAVDDEILWAECVVATEMLEHLADPHGFVRKVASHSRFIVASSPWTENDMHHDPIHLWAWDVEGYARLIGYNGFVILRHETVGNFQVIMGVAQ